MNKKLNEIIENNFDRQIKDTAELIQIKSVYSEDEGYPFGKGTADCLALFLKKAEDMGFTVKNVDNHIGWAEIGSGKMLYGILAHLDTVPEGDEDKWQVPPFSGEIKDGAIYGRGSEDDKGPAVAALYAMKALKESGEKLKARFRIIVGLDEETGFRCVERYLQTEDIPFFSFSPDASFPLINGEKGIMQFSLKRTFMPSAPGIVKLFGMKGGRRFNIVPDTAYAYFSGNTAKAELLFEELNNPDISLSYKDNFLEVKANGLSAHAMCPEKGKNAILILLNALSEVDFVPNELMRWIKIISAFLKNETDGRSLGLAMEDDISGKLTLNTSLINFDGKDMVIRFDMRYPVTAKPKKMEQLIKDTAKKLGMMININTHKPPLYVPETLKEVKELLKAYKDVTGEEGKPFSIGGGTYCKAFPNAVTFGAMMPGEKELAHEENECISLNTLKNAAKIYANALYRLNKIA